MVRVQSQVYGLGFYSAPVKLGDVHEGRLFRLGVIVSHQVALLQRLGQLSRPAVVLGVVLGDVRRRDAAGRLYAGPNIRPCLRPDPVVLV